MEVVVSVLILAILLSGVLAAYRRTCDVLLIQNLRERAAAVAQRRMELLLANQQEPNSHELHGTDELDSLFEWRMSLQRESVGRGRAGDRLSGSIIRATVVVEADLPETRGEPLIELVRMFGSLKPLPGQEVAVPFVSDREEGEVWYEQLRQSLGREPTIEEILAELTRMGDLSAEELEMLEETEEPEPQE